MNHWVEHSKSKSIIISGNKLSKKILIALAGIIGEKSEFYSLRTPLRTRLIKDTLCILANKVNPRYKVYANGLSHHLRQTNGGDFKNREFLWDLHWYTEAKNEQYFPLSLPLVVECEWKSNAKKGYNSVKFDFQKLITSNAGLRVMIFRIRNRNKGEDLENIGKYFVSLIEKYIHLDNGAKFLFVAFFKGKDGNKGFFYMEYQKRGDKKIIV